MPIALVSSFSEAMGIICDKMGAHFVDSGTVGIIETGVTLILLLVLLAYKGNVSVISSIDRQVLPYLLASAFFGGISLLSYYVIMNYTNVSRAASVDQFTIVFILCLSVIFLRETITWKSAIGSIFLLVGIGCLVL